MFHLRPQKSATDVLCASRGCYFGKVLDERVSLITAVKADNHRPLTSHG